MKLNSERQARTEVDSSTVAEVANVKPQYCKYTCYMPPFLCQVKKNILKKFTKLK